MNPPDNKQENKIFNLGKIKEEVKLSLQNGAVTSDYTLNLETACNLLNQSLATELMCVLRYRNHQIIATGMNYIQISAEFKEHAEQEEKHALILAKRIHDLGGSPGFHPKDILSRSSADYGNATDLVSMIKENLIAERVAIETYRKLIDWFGSSDSTTRRILERILEEEEDHASDLADLLATENSQPASLFGQKESH